MIKDNKHIESKFIQTCSIQFQHARITSSQYECIVIPINVIQMLQDYPNAYQEWVANIQLFKQNLIKLLLEDLENKISEFEYQCIKNRISIVFSCIPFRKSIYKRLNNLTQKDINTWLVIDGTIIRSNQKQALEKSKLFQCSKCSHEIRLFTSYHNNYRFEFPPCQNMVEKQANTNQFMKFINNMVRRKSKSKDKDHPTTDTEKQIKKQSGTHSKFLTLLNMQSNIQFGCDFLLLIFIMIRTNYKNIQLPKDFAWELMDNEIEFQLGQNVNINLVQKLLSLYAMGVEYYESLRSYKYLYFQKKMSSLMKSPVVMKSMNQHSNQSPTKPLPKQQNVVSPQKKEQQLKIMMNKQKQDEMQKNIMYSTAEISTSKVKDMIENTQKQAIQYQQKIKNQITQQEDKIQQKIFKRRTQSKKSLSKSFSAMQFDMESCSESPVKCSSPTKIQVSFTSIINQNQDQQQNIVIKLPPAQSAKQSIIKPKPVIMQTNTNKGQQE